MFTSIGWSLAKNRDCQGTSHCDRAQKRERRTINYLLFKGVSLRHNLHIIQFTHLKCAMNGFQFFHKYVHLSPPKILEHFRHLKKQARTHWLSLPQCPRPSLHSTKQRSLCFRSPRTPLLWTFRMNGIVRNGLFHNCLLPLSMIHVIARNATSFLYMTKHNSLCMIGHVLFHRALADGHLGCFYRSLLLTMTLGWKN